MVRVTQELCQLQSVLWAVAALGNRSQSALHACSHARMVFRTLHRHHSDLAKVYYIEVQECGSILTVKIIKKQE